MLHEMYFGEFGGRYVPETLQAVLCELATAYAFYHNDTEFLKSYHYHLKHFVGRPTPLTLASNLSDYAGNARIFLKREDLAHTGAHKINNALGQALLAKSMGKRHVIAETGAGQHGVATAAVCALLKLPCTIYMGALDMQRQSLNVSRMKLFGAEIKSVSSGNGTLKDAVSEALRHWVAAQDSYYLLGSAVGPDPFPTIVRDFQKIIGHEARVQILQQANVLPDKVIACVGGGSNAIGIFQGFMSDSQVQLIGVEAGGDGVRHGAKFSKGSIGIFHGMKTYVLQDGDGQIESSHSISAGLDYSAVGPEHAYLFATKRAQYTSITDEEAIAAAKLLMQTEGILPALESAHAIAHAVKISRHECGEQTFLVNLSGRGDKDLAVISGAM